MFEIRTLHARIAEDGTEIIRGLNLTVKKGEVAAIMGPNGSGKSTLSYVLAGREDYEVTAPPKASSSPSSIRWRYRAWRRWNSSRSR